MYLFVTSCLDRSEPEWSHRLSWAFFNRGTHLLLQASSIRYLVPGIRYCRYCIPIPGTGSMQIRVINSSYRCGRVTSTTASAESGKVSHVKQHQDGKRCVTLDKRTGDADRGRKGEGGDDFDQFHPGHGSARGQQNARKRK